MDGCVCFCPISVAVCREMSLLQADRPSEESYRLFISFRMAESVPDGNRPESIILQSRRRKKMNTSGLSKFLIRINEKQALKLSG